MTENSRPGPIAPPVFRARGLTKTYGSGTAEVRALAGVDLDLYAGELIVLLGPSGSGKTTLLNQLGGLDVPTSGELWYRDIDLTNADEAQLTRYRRDSVGFIFQFYNLIPSLTARENVALITEIARDPMPAEQALDMVGLAPRLDHFPAQLSGGEQQMLAIGRALMSRPRLLLLDEPSLGLAPLIVQALFAVIADLRRRGTTVLLVEQNARAALGLCDRAVVLERGTVIVTGRGSDLLHDPALHAAYFGGS